MASVASEPPPSILARVDRLDIMLGYLEELRGSRGSTSTATTTTTTTSGGGGGVVAPSDGGNSVNSSPMSFERRRCRPIGDVVVETQVKGNLIDRVQHLEIRLLKLESEMEIEEKKKGEEEKRARKGRGLKRLVESCVRGDLKTKE